MTRSIRSSAAALLLLAAFAPLGEAQQQPPDQPPPGAARAEPEKATLTFNFQRASVQAFLGFLSKEAGFTFVTDAGVQGEITAVAAKPLTPTEALDVLTNWLLPRDRTTIRTGRIVRIVTLEEAKKRGLPVRIGSNPQDIKENDELVTQVMPLRHVQAQVVKQQLEPLLSEQGRLMIEPGSNALVVRDVSSNIRRFAEVLQALDTVVTSTLKVTVHRLLNAEAEGVAKIIRDLFSAQSVGGQGGQQQGGRGGRGGGPGGGFRQMAQAFLGGGPGGPGAAPGGAAAGTGARVSPVLVSTDTRTNSVVVTASEDQSRLIEQLVKQLDKDPDTVVTQIKGFRLLNADAATLATTLKALFEDDAAAQQRGRQGNQQQQRFMRMIAGMQQGGEGEAKERNAPKPKFTTDERTNTLIASATATDLKMIESLVQQLDKDPTEKSSVLVLPLRNGKAQNLAAVLTNALKVPTGTAQQRQQQQRGGGAATAAGSGGVGNLVGEVTVVADTESNALVVTTSPRNFDRVRQIVYGLDRVRREVFIEALIAEVTLTDKGELGIQWNTAFTNSADNKKDGTQSVGTDFGLDSLRDGLRYTTTSEKLTGLLRMLKTEGRLNILSSPKVLALENQQAEISVGQEVPFVTNSRITQNGDTVNTIQYRNVGVILRVTPQMNDDGYVRMVVHPEVSSIAPEAESVPITEGVRSPTFNKNFADTSIVVRDGETAVIGGLIRDSYSETKFKIPVLGDLPVIGPLFGATTREKVKQELVVFLTPRVVESSGDLRRNTRRTFSQYALIPSEMVKIELERWLRNLEEETHPYAYNKGTVLLESGRVDAAKHELSRASKLKPNDCASRFNLGLALAQAGNYEEAEAELRKAELLDRHDPEIPYNIAALLWRRGDYPRATAKLKRVLELNARHEAALRWLPRAEERMKQLESELLKFKPSSAKGTKG